MFGDVKEQFWGRLNIFSVVRAFLLCSLFLCPLHAKAGKADISVVVSSGIRPYVEALEGLRSGFQSALTIYYLDSNPELVRHRLRQKRFDLVIAIGPEASILTWSILKPEDKKIALMVLDPQDLLGDPDPCGVDLRVSMEDQMRLIVDRLGDDRKIGILYNPVENEEWIKRAQKEGDCLRTDVIPLPVHSKQEITKVLSSGYRHIDTLLFIPDSTVISEALLLHLVKDALLHRIAVVGYNHFFVEIGAVMAFSINYKKVGIIGSEIARKVLSNSQGGLYSPPFQVEWNEKTWKAISEKSDDAEKSGVEGNSP